MKHLVDIINESNIDRIERKYREFCGVCKVYDPNIDMKNVCVHKTSKNNWAVYVKDGDKCKKLFIASYMMLDDDIIKRNGIEVCNESLNEAKDGFEVSFIRYDPDALSEYEKGEIDIDELHDSIAESDYDRVPLKANEDKKAVREAEPIIKKMVNKHPEICGGIVYDMGGNVVENIFI